MRPYPGETWHPAARASVVGVARSVRPEATFVGDDNVVGAGATTAARRWSTLMADRQGWKELSFGQSGTGYVNPGGRAGDTPLLRRVSKVIASQPDVVVVSAGMNDVERRYTKPEIRSAVNRTHRRLRARLPNARIIAIARCTPNSNPPRKLAVARRLVKSAALHVNAQYVPTRSWLDKLAQRLAGDDHLNDAGYRMLVTRIGTTLFGPRVVPVPGPKPHSTP